MDKHTQLIYGIAIFVLAIVVTGIVCYLGNVRVPYISSQFAPTVEPVMVQNSHTVISQPQAPAADVSSTSKK